jgi:sugar lactone lactonase YvrE
MQYRHLGKFGGRGSAPHQFAATLHGITVDSKERLYAVGDSEVKVFESSGEFLRSWQTGLPGFSVAVSEQAVYVGQEGQLEIFDLSGKLLDTWQDPSLLGRVTAVQVVGEYLLVADSQDRCIRRFDRQGACLNSIGKENRMKGFNIPNGALDFSVDEHSIIHACNPGKHRVERYSLEGELLGHIGRFDGRDPQGFPGCCNPTNVAVSGQGLIYVTEKAGPRAKVLANSGNLLAVIATDVFDPNCKNMDITVDSGGRVYVADTVRLEINVFGPEDGGSSAPRLQQAEGI